MYLMYMKMVSQSPTDIGNLMPYLVIFGPCLQRKITPAVLNDSTKNVLRRQLDIHFSYFCHKNNEDEWLSSMVAGSNCTNNSK